MLSNSVVILSSLSICSFLISCCSGAVEDMEMYRVSPKLMGPFQINHDLNDSALNRLDESLAKISSTYMQALFSGTHTPELERGMQKLEIDLFDQLDSLFKDQRLKDYMKYEKEVTRQLIIYNMLKKLFGYDDEEAGKIK